MKKVSITLIAVLFFLSNILAGPCNTIITITCGTPVTFSVPAVAGDPQFPSGLGSCGGTSASNGLETIYKFKAPISGVYQFGTTTATTSVVQYSYKSAGLPCDSSGWKCLGYTKAVAVYLAELVLNANDSIYILANCSVVAAIQQSFQINCALPIPLVCDSIYPVHVDTGYVLTFAQGFGSPLFPNTIGNQNCTSFIGVGGTEKIVKLKATQDGNYLITSDMAYFGSISYLYKDASLGCDTAFFKCMGLLNNTSQTLYSSIFLHAGDSILILIKNLGLTSQRVKLKITLTPTYCNAIVPISCGVQNIFSPSYIDSTELGYNNGMGSNCFQNAGKGGSATIYKLKAPLSGTYQLSTGAASNGVMEYFYKNAALGCGTTGWQCINYTALAIPNLWSITLAAGDSILLMVKAENKLSIYQSQTFQFSCPAGCPKLDTPAVVSNKSFTFCKGDSIILSLSPALPASAAVSWYYYQNYSINPNDYLISTSYQNPLIVKNTGYVLYTVNYCGSSITGKQTYFYKLDTLPKITIATTSTLTQCAISNPSFTLNCTNTFSSPVHYTWKRNGSTIGIDTSFLTTNLAGTYTLQVSNGCGLPKTSDSIVTTVTPAYTGPRPHLVFTGPNPFCSTDTTVTLSITPIPRAKTYILKQTGSTGSTYSSNSNTFKVNANGLYYLSNFAYYIDVIDSCGQHILSDTLYGTHTKQLPIDPFSINHHTLTTLCDDKGPVSLYVVAPSAGTIYDWKADGISQNIQSSSVSVNSTVLVTLSLSNVCGVVNSSNSVPVVIKPASPVTYQTATICPGASYPFYGQTLTSAGTYTKLYYNVSGCDSIISLDLSFSAPPMPTIVQNGNTLSVQPSYTSYQWFLYGNPVSNSAQITVYTSGLYTVKGVDANGCENTSDAFSFTPTGIKDENNEHFSISPNPVKGNLEIRGIESNTFYKVVITDIQGRVILKTETDKHIINVESLINGLYLIHIALPHNQNIVKRFIKQDN